jgi:hypothetical protein
MDKIFMIGQILSHNRILEKLGVGGMFQNHPRAFFESGWKFADLPPYGFRSERDSKNGTAAGGSRRKNI